MDAGLRLGSAWFQILRRSPQAQMGLSLVLLTTVVVSIFRFQLWTGQSSLDDALAVCKENYLGAYMKFNDVDREEAEEYYEGNASLGDGNRLNTGGFAVSVLCFVLWMFRSPHHSSQESSMDKQRKLTCSL